MIQAVMQEFTRNKMLTGELCEQDNCMKTAVALLKTGVAVCEECLQAYNKSLEVGCGRILQMDRQTSRDGEKGRTIAL